MLQTTNKQANSTQTPAQIRFGAGGFSCIILFNRTCPRVGSRLAATLNKRRPGAS